MVQGYLLVAGNMVIWRRGSTIERNDQMTTPTGRRVATCDNVSTDGCKFANQAAEDAVHKTFAILGVNIDDPKQVSAFQDDLRFNSKLRRYMDHGPVVAFFAGVGFTLMTIVLGYKFKIFGS